VGTQVALSIALLNCSLLMARGVAGYMHPTFSSAVRTALNTLAPTIQVRDILPLEDVGREGRAIFAGTGGALAALGGMAPLLSVIGTYAILSLSVTRRTREIGIRTALGATRRQVLQSIMGRTTVPPAIGAIVGIGLGHALVAARHLRVPIARG
jgi:predicted lysophospholipase L1 biosynthesis ABC-type transport system permease subunit